MKNIGSALLILGVIYLHLEHGLDLAVTIGFCIIGLLAWVFYFRSSETKEEQKAQTELFRAKAEYYRQKARGLNEPSEK